MTDRALVVAHGLTKHYGSAAARVTALDGVDVTVQSGELLAVTGRSGSGKTTLLHCLSGIAIPDQGTVQFDGVDLAAAGERARTDLRASRMAFVFQTLNLLPALTVAENVELPLVLRGADAAAVRRERGTALAQVELDGRDDAYPAQLSGGEQQRVAVARALVTQPDVIWADEPTGALDSGSAAHLMRLLRAAAGGGRTVVVVSHAAEVAAVADRVITMRDGRIAPGSST